MIKVTGGAPALAPTPAADAQRPNQVAPRAAPDASSFAAPRRAAPVALAVPQAKPTAIPTVTPEDVDRISAMTDGVARNYLITQGYADLSNQTAAILGRENGNWCTFGVWASKQAGVSIRGEDLPKFVTKALQALPGIASAEAKVNAHLKAMGLPQLPSIPDVILQGGEAQKAMTEMVAGGNQTVFAEVGREFAVFNQTFAGATHYDQAKVDQFLAHFPPEQQALKDGFATYCKAQFETDPKAKAQLMLSANTRIVAYEQNRLQQYIAGAMNSPDGVFHTLIQGAVDKVTSHLPGPLKWLAKTELNHFGGVDALTQAVDGVFRHAATEMMMQLSTPNETLHLGDDLPNPPGQSTPFPKDLAEITDPGLLEQYEKLDQSGDSMKGTGVADWSDYGDRMNYIVHLFRSRQQDPSLFDPPFASRPPALVA